MHDRRMSVTVAVAVIGAGPYGLSIAAHLRAARIPFRIFGIPMQSWREQMPAHMMLKSEGFASNLYDPDGALTLRAYCRDRSLPYADVGCPVPLDTMSAYGLAFQRQLVPELEQQLVERLVPDGPGFGLTLANGDYVLAQSVIVATGLSHFRHLPQALSHLPGDLLSHSADHRDVGGFRSRHVTVVGGGSSALDLAADLHEAGADVRMLVRRRAVLFNTAVRAERTKWETIRYPLSGIGDGIRARFFTDAPGLFRLLPQSVRLRTVRTFLGPSGGYHVRARVEECVPTLTGCEVVSATPRQGRVVLNCRDAHGRLHVIETEHVIAATGFRSNLHRLPFLDPVLAGRIRAVENTPVLSAHFESSVRDLFFVGMSSANTFGPMMRFMFGARYTADRLTRRLAGAGAVS